MAHEVRPGTPGEPVVGARARRDVDIGDVVDLVKDYARQETLGPLRGAGRWLAFGAVGSLLIGIGSVILVLGVLRLFQTGFDDTFEGEWMSLLPYVIALAVALVIVGIAVSRISKTSLHDD